MKSKVRRISVCYAGMVAVLGLTTLSDAGRGMVFPGAEWEERTPESQGLDAAALQSAMDYLAGECGDDGTREALVIRNGYLIWKGDNTHNMHDVWSCTKIFTSTVLGLLVDDGACGLDSLTADFVPVLSTLYPDVTLRHFANFTSGYDGVGGAAWGGDMDGSDTPFDPTTPLFEPGTAYAYWDDAMNMLAHILTQIAREQIEELFERRIADPIGMTRDEWDWGDWGTYEGFVVNGGAGTHDMGMHISAQQLARLGHLFLNRGLWGASPLISEAWVDAATQNQVPASIEVGDTPRSDIDGRGIYGYHWWVNGIQADGERHLPGAPLGTFYRTGYPHNMLFVIPEWSMVIVRIGLDPAPSDRMGVWDTVLGMIGDAIGDVEEPSVTGFTLVDADSDEDIGPLSDGDVLILAELSTTNLNVRAETEPAVTGSVRFELDSDTDFALENTEPYALAGDSAGDYAAWTPGAGPHTLTATPYTGANGTGTVGSELTVTFTVFEELTDDMDPEAPPDASDGIPVDGPDASDAVVDTAGDAGEEGQEDASTGGGCSCGIVS